MKALNKIIATGLVAESNFITNLGNLIEQCPKIAEFLAEGIQPKMNSEEISCKAALKYEKGEQTITKISDPFLSRSLEWQVQVYYSYPRYYQHEDHSDYGTNMKNPNYPYKNMEETYSIMDIE